METIQEVLSIVNKGSARSKQERKKFINTCKSCGIAGPHGKNPRITPEVKEKWENEKWKQLKIRSNHETRSEQSTPISNLEFKSGSLLDINDLRPHVMREQ